tara:strand:- start:196 stop:678 length:483 start_codon:yes stop_codon:yes gene_type:complete
MRTELETFARMQIQAECVKKINETGGFTLTPRGARRLLQSIYLHKEAAALYVDELFHEIDMGGFAVSIHDGDFMVSGVCDDSEDVEKFVKEHLWNTICLIVQDYPEAYVGAWLSDDGLIYIDPIVVLDDFTEATELAEANDQIAIYDFRKAESVYREEWA